MKQSQKCLTIILVVYSPLIRTLSVTWKYNRPKVYYYIALNFKFGNIGFTFLYIYVTTK